MRYLSIAEVLDYTSGCLPIQAVLPVSGILALSNPQSVNLTPPSAASTFILTSSTRPLPFATR